MTQEQKDLLLQDLCARLPYGVWFEGKLKSCKFGAKSMLHAHNIDAIKRGRYDFYKPYLFPLSSMTEEQNLEYLSTCRGGNSYCPTSKTFDWFDKNHFDYRDLIPMGLAIDATNKNIY